MFNYKRASALSKITRERERQDILKSEGRFEFTAADSECPNHLRLEMLVEEIGEVARAKQNKDNGNLKEELVQTAAICLAWLEYLESVRG